MMNQSKPWNSYRRVATQTATPGQLVLMLFDGAIRFLECSRQGFGEDDPARFNETVSNNILRAQDIVRELNASLNMEAGGEFSANMRRLYEYLDWRLQQSNLRKEEEGIVEVIQHLTILRDAWRDMLRGDSSATSVSELSGAMATAAA